MSGDRTTSSMDGARTFMGDGYGPTTDGIGCPMSHLDGQHTTMDDGSMTITMDGYGFLMMCGALPG